MTIAQQTQALPRTAKARLTNIKSKLNAFNKGFDGKNWGYVGSLDYINGLLLQIEQHLG